MNRAFRLLAAKPRSVAELRESGYAALSLQPDPADPGDPAQAWLVLRAAAEQPMPAAWLAALDAAMALAPGPDTLEYRDARRGLLKRVAWRQADAGNFIDGLLWSGAGSGGDALLSTALAGRPWQGARLAAFSAAATAPRDPVVCTCRQVTESAIRAAVRDGADLAALRQGLGCGSVCGSCVPQLTRFIRQAADA